MSWWPRSSRSVGSTGPPPSPGPTDARPTVRDTLLDMTEEYARHTGHADILRDAADGRVGEGAPGTSSSEFLREVRRRPASARSSMPRRGSAPRPDGRAAAGRAGGPLPRTDRRRGGRVRTPR
nr:hypothetical protein C5F59_34295 [Streptomyces sp. QL37]